MTRPTPKTRVDAVAYLASLSSVALYLDKTGVEYHAAKVTLEAEFARAFEEFNKILQGEVEEEDE